MLLIDTGMDTELQKSYRKEQGLEASYSVALTVLMILSLNIKSKAHNSRVKQHISRRNPWQAAFQGELFVPDLLPHPCKLLLSVTSSFDLPHGR